MINLTQRMAEHGFESNQDYSFVLKTLAADFKNSVPCLCVLGPSGRRKTAFANALAHSQDGVEHILYFDFSASEEPAPQLIVPANIEEDMNSEHLQAVPISAFDRMMSDACAYSEAERTILILDQLQVADFKQHIRIYEFLQSGEWHYQGSSFFANRHKLMLYIISEGSVYHSLQKHSFKVWIASDNGMGTRYSCADLQLPARAQGLLNSFYELFALLDIYPTYSEWQKIIRAAHQRVRTRADLQNCLYGWVEHIERAALEEPAIGEFIDHHILTAIADYVGVETVQIG